MSTTYATLREKIAAEKRERTHRYEQFARLWDKAHKAGIAAGNAVTPAPMIVRNGSIRVNGDTLYDAPDSAIVEVVPGGVCGFAWIVTHPGNSSFARWAVKFRRARKEYGGGVRLRWVGEFNQSMTRKEAYADAFAETLRAAGIDAHSCSRMD